MTRGIITLSIVIMITIMTHKIMILSIMTHSKITHSITALSIMTKNAMILRLQHSLKQHSAFATQKYNLQHKKNHHNDI